MTACLKYYTIEFLIIISYNVLSTIIINTAASQTTRIPLMVFVVSLTIQAISFLLLNGYQVLLLLDLTTSKV